MGTATIPALTLTKDCSLPMLVMRLTRVTSALQLMDLSLTMRSSGGKKKVTQKVAVATAIAAAAAATGYAQEGEEHLGQQLQGPVGQVMLTNQSGNTQDPMLGPILFLPGTVLCHANNTCYITETDKAISTTLTQTSTTSAVLCLLLGSAPQANCQALPSYTC